MNEYTEECLKTFLKNQGQLFDESVAENLEEAEEFLEDCMAVVVDSLGRRPRLSGRKRYGRQRHERRRSRRNRGSLRPG